MLTIDTFRYQMRNLIDEARTNSSIPATDVLTTLDDMVAECQTAETKNEHYGALNNRFDKRAAELRDLGFSYMHLAEHGIAVFTAKRCMRTKTLPASLVMNADSVVWKDYLEEVKRFVA